MHDETYEKAYGAFEAEGILDELWPLLVDFLKSLLSGCNMSSERLAADLDSADEKVKRRLRAQTSVRLRLWLFQTYGPGAWRDYDGPALVEQLLSAGKKATASGIAMVRAS